MGTGTTRRAGAVSIWGSNISASKALLYKKRKNSTPLGLFKLLLIYEKISNLQVLPTTRISPGKKGKLRGARGFTGHLLSCTGTAYWLSHFIFSFFLRAIDPSPRFTGEKAVAWVGKLLVKDAMSSYGKEATSCIVSLLPPPPTACTFILTHRCAISNGQSCPTMD